MQRGTNRAWWCTPPAGRWTTRTPGTDYRPRRAWCRLCLRLRQWLGRSRPERLH